MTQPIPESEIRFSRNHRATWLTFASCAAMLMVFYCVAWFAISSHSATIDEPLHATGAYMQTFQNDFRIDPEDPPLWKYWAMLPHRAGSLREPPSPGTQRHGTDPSTLAYLSSVRWLFQSPDNDGAAFINKSRAVMLILGAALGAAIAAWSFRLAGATAAIAACALFAFDPNFLAHAPLVKNDVSLSLVLFGLVVAVWSVGKRARWWNILLVALICGAAVTVKFSGVLAGVIVILMLGVRAMMRDNWIVLGRLLVTRWSRALAALAACGFAIGVSIVMIWATYGFRFEPTSSPANLLGLQAQIDVLKQQNYYVSHNRTWPSDDQLHEIPDPFVARGARFVQEHRLLPQPWIYGFLFTYRSTLMRPNFLLGERGELGHWHYFPLTAIFKTPVATLVAMAIALAIVIRWRRVSWSTVCLIVPFMVYGASAITSNLNLGLRHILPLYPIIYVAIGIAAARIQSRHPRRFLRVAGVLGIVLVFETLTAFPHYISFFNSPSRPFRLNLLSDSNFDWGQELTFVAEWQQRNPNTRLYLGYLGGVDPAFYGIEYTNIPGGFMINPQWQWPPTTPGVVAISATLLQGVNCPPSCIAFYAPFRERKPKEMIGDTIYVYDWPLKP